MMGVSAGTADAIGQLKEILELASDPKKLAKVVAELEKVSSETKALLEEKAKVEMEASAKLKKLAEATAEFEVKSKEFSKISSETQNQQQVLASTLADIKTREQKLKAGMQALEEDRAEHAMRVAQQKTINEQMNANVAKKLAEAEALKIELEARLAKLKQAMG